MTAEHEIALIVAAWQKGIRIFDAEKAYKAMRRDSDDSCTTT